jgi:hypothetical protein
MQLILSDISDPELKFELSGQFIKLMHQGDMIKLIGNPTFKLLAQVMHDNSCNLFQQMTPDDFTHLIGLALIPKTTHAEFVKEIQMVHALHGKKKDQQKSLKNQKKEMLMADWNEVRRTKNIYQTLRTITPDIGGLEEDE